MRKVWKIQYQNLKIQKYLKSKTLSTQMSKFIFILRSRMLDISTNYKNKSTLKFCPVCRDENNLDTQEHLMICPLLVSQNQLVQGVVPKYEDLFEDDVEKQTRVASIIQVNFRKRKKKVRD